MFFLRKYVSALKVDRPQVYEALDEHIIISLTLTALSTAIVVFNLFYYKVKSLLLWTKWVFKHVKDLQIFGLKLNK